MRKITKEHKEMMQIINTSVFLIDGKRTIAEKVEQQLGKISIPLLVEIVTQYEKERIIKFL